jgi:ATP-dependent helicase/nuclease subunit A
LNYRTKQVIILSKQKIWTREQKAAIEERGALLISAGAGSGKTAVLIERIMAYVTDLQHPCHVDEFLVVTYTKAAAAEMKARLRGVIEHKLALADDPAESEHLLTQFLLINQAKITTLHALGSDILRQYFYLLEIEPNFYVMEEAQAQLLLLELAETLINEAYEASLNGQGDPADFLYAAQFFSSGYKDKFLVDTILEVRKFAMSQPKPHAWLEGLAQVYALGEEDFIRSPWGRAFLDHSQSLLDEAESVLQEAILLAQLPDGPREYVPALELDRQNVRHLRELMDSQDLFDSQGLCRALGQTSHPRLAPVNTRNSPERDIACLEEAKSAVQRFRKIYKDNLDKLKDKWVAPSLAEHLAAGHASGQIVRVLADLTQRLADRYQEEKRRRNCVDFSDLEHLPLRLFHGNPSVAESFRQQFHEVLVDEYQDISPVQEELLQMMSRPNHQFLVGDIKQSIYRFRMADPGLFNMKYASFLPWESPYEEKLQEEKPQEEKPHEGDQGRVIDLRHNFRSRPQIIAAVNEVFRRLMNRETAEIDYDTRAELVAAGTFFAADDVSGEDEDSSLPGGPVEIHIVERAPKTALLSADMTGDEGQAFPGQPEESENSGDSRFADPGVLPFDLESVRLEAYVVAEQICRMVNDPFFVSCEAGPRPVSYKDMAVLMRSAAAAMPVYREVFDAYGIPYAGAEGAGAYEPVEMEIAVALLSVIDNPHQDIPLLAVLRSFLVGLTAEHLSLIRLICPGGNFYEALCAAALWGSESIIDIDTAGSQDAGDWTAACAEALSGFDDEKAAQMKRHAWDLTGHNTHLSECLRGFCRSLIRWRVMAAREDLPEFIWRVYQETGILNYADMMPEGQRRRNNLLCLYENAVSFARDHSRSLAAFLRFLEKTQEILPARAPSHQLPQGSSGGEDFDRVRFMTIHGSKGLEFPVVFVVSLGNRFNRTSLMGKVLLHKDLGVGIAGADAKCKVIFPSPVKEAVRWVLSAEAAAEELRVFYVALTRAKEKLILVGTSSNLPKTLESFRAAAPRDPLSPYGVRKALSCLDWLEMALKEGGREGCTWETTPHTFNEIRKVMNMTPKHKPRSTESAEHSQGDQAPEPITLEDLDNKLMWIYPHTDQFVKMSVTSLRHLWKPDLAKRLMDMDMDMNMGMDIDVDTDIDTDIDIDIDTDIDINFPFSPELGTMIHKYLQHIPWRLWAAQWADWNNQQRHEALEGHLRDLAGRELILPDMAQAMPLNNVAAFLSSPLGMKIFLADEIYTEMPFILGMVFGAEKKKILVQGTTDLVAVYHSGGERRSQADCALTDPCPAGRVPADHALIVDFKTDRIHPGRTEVLAEKYALQLAVYSAAVQNLLRVEVQDTLIYAFRANSPVAVGEKLMQEALDEAGLSVYNETSEEEIVLKKKSRSLPTVPVT